jgi:glycerophosphoryl diester phosphodiesterase
VLTALRGAWKPLVAYELLVSALAVLAFGPLLVALSYRLIEFTGEPILGNSELADFLLSPLGLVALLLGLSLMLGLLLIQYSGLIVMIHDALTGQATALRRTLGAVIAAAPRLLVLAAIQIAGALAIALPILGLGALAYWLLLSADINYYLAVRPPRFWVAAAVGAALAVALSATTSWFFLRFALAVPACVLERQPAWSALRFGLQISRRRVLRLLLVIVVWVLVEQILLIVSLAGLDGLNELLLSRLQGSLTLLLWSTAAVLLLDAVVLQVLGTGFAIGRALLITTEYEQASRSNVSPALASRVPAPPAPREFGGPWRIVAVAAVFIGPAASVLYAVAMARDMMEHRPVRITAHRAGSAHAPENSIAALRRALAAGTDDVEVDVQLTADGQVVLMHDRDLRRMTGDPRAVSEVTLADLQQLRLRDTSGNAEEPIPTLSEFLAACDDTVRLNIELKETGRAPGLPRAVVDVVRQHDMTDRAGVSCFHLPPLLAVRINEPPMPIGMILSAVQGDMTRLPVDFLSLHQRLVSAPLVRRAHERGMEVHVWSVNDRETALRQLDLGCDNLITSDPVEMRKLVDWYQKLGDVERMLMRLRRWMRDN